MPWLRGFANSKPVRIGNAAHGQLQLDVFGEMMDALYQARRGGLPESEPAWDMECALLQHLASIWSSLTLASGKFEASLAISPTRR